RRTDRRHRRTDRPASRRRRIADRGKSRRGARRRPGRGRVVPRRRRGLLPARQTPRPRRAGGPGGLPDRRRGDGHRGRETHGRHRERRRHRRGRSRPAGRQGAGHGVVRRGHRDDLRGRGTEVRGRTRGRPGTDRRTRAAPAAWRGRESEEVIRVAQADESKTAEGKTAEGKNTEPKGGRPGPKDEGRDGGMATREIAPELTTPDKNDDSA